MTWKEAMRRFGSDKPDLRINLELIDVAALVADSTFTPFTDAVAHPNGRVAALRIPSGTVLSRKQIDEYAAYTAKYGATGLAYAKLAPTGEITSPIAKFFPRMPLLHYSHTSGRRKATSCFSVLETTTKSPTS